MTSQRFSNDKVAVRDFLRSLKDCIGAPIIAFAVMSFLIIGKIAAFSKGIKKNAEILELIKNKEIISYFGGATSPVDYNDSFPLSLVMIFCGIVIAFSLFKFAFKKNSVNVYFSVGITRTRMFFNRIAAGVAELLVISVIPYLVVFAVNVSLFGFHTHQLKLFAYYTLLAFVSGVSGFAIGTFAATVSGSGIETIITAGAASFIFVIFAGVISLLKEIFLRGYIDYGDVALNKILKLSPWTSLFERMELGDLVRGKSVPKEFLLTWEKDFSSITFWAVASVIIFAVSLFLFKKRKNENTASFGKYAVSSALNGASIFFIAVFICTGIFFDLYSANKLNSVALCIILSTVISFIVFFVAELIIRRNIKAAVRMLPLYGGLAIVMFASLIVISTENFGTYNKLPDIKDVEYISMDYIDPLDMFSYSTHIGVNTYDTLNDVKSSNPEDIKMCFEQFEKVKNDKCNDADATAYLNFRIKTKDGKSMLRRFSVCSEAVVHDYNKAVFESEYFHSVIKRALKSDEAEKTETISYDDVYSSVDRDYDSRDYFEYFGGSLLADGDKTGISSEMTNELREAIYNDMCKMTYDEYYGKAGVPVGALVIYNSLAAHENTPYFITDMWFQFNLAEGEEESENSAGTFVASGEILVYPQMVNTLKLIKEYGLEPVPHTASVKAVICPDKKMLLSDAFANVGGDKAPIICLPLFNSADASSVDWYGVYDNDVTKLFINKEQGTYLDFMEIVYSANDVKLSRIDDKAKAEKIADAARAVYDTYGDNGRFVYIIYDDGSVITKYLPEKSMSLLN